MKFVKMQGLGNDYVYINGFTEVFPRDEELIKAISDRHFGIGSDGVILINPSKVADFEMEMYNADGSRGEMCGNGIRCVGKFVYDFGLTKKTRISIETLGGIKYLDLKVENGKVKTVKVDMGVPELICKNIPVKFDKEKMIGEKVTIHGEEYDMTCVSMGNPHAVVFIDDVDELEIHKVGPRFEKNKMFPNRVNTEFAKVLDRKTIQMRVWERGSGETFACGTGACAVAVAAILNGFADNEVTVKLLGGDLKITWDGDGSLYMEGAAEMVYEGTVNLRSYIK